jgi:hypothetical protein
VIISIVYIYVCFKSFFLFYNNFYIKNQNDILLIDYNLKNVTFELFNNNFFFYELNNFFFLRHFFIFSINKFNIIFILLFASLYPIISYLVISDDNFFSFRYYFHIQLVFCLSFILLLTENIILFYFIYEIIIILMYSVLNLSSNSRGNIEASLFFLG